MAVVQRRPRPPAGQGGGSGGQRHAARGGGDAWARRPFAVRGRSQLLRGTPGFAFFRAGELTHTSTPPFPGLRLSRDRAPGKVTLWGRGQVPSAGSPCSATSPAGDPGRSLDRWPATPRHAPSGHPGGGTHPRPARRRRIGAATCIFCPSPPAAAAQVAALRGRAQPTAGPRRAPRLCPGASPLTA